MDLEYFSKYLPNSKDERKKGGYTIRLCTKDMSMDSLEEMRFKKKHSELITRLSKKLHFTYNELECIMLIYYKVQKDGPEKQGGINRAQFRDVLHKGLDMTDDTLMDRIYLILDTFEKGTRANKDIISMEMWASAMSLFLRGTLEEKIAYCFAVYDTMGDGMIARDGMFQLLRSSIIKQVADDDVDEGIKDMVDVILKKMDLDRDGKVSFKDYKTTVLKAPMLLEALGQCLPTRLAVHAFLTSFTKNIGKV